MPAVLLVETMAERESEGTRVSIVNRTVLSCECLASWLLPGNFLMSSFKQ